MTGKRELDWLLEDNEEKESRLAASLDDDLAKAIKETERSIWRSVSKSAKGQKIKVTSVLDAQA